MPNPAKSSLSTLRLEFSLGNSIKLVLLSLIFLLYVLVISPSNCHAQWVQVSNGMGNQEVLTLTTNASTVFAGTGTSPCGNGVYLSTNNGTNWSQSFLNGLISALASNENYIFAGVWCEIPSGLYISTNNGLNWTNSGLYLGVNSLAVDGIYTYVGTEDSGVYFSTNNGTNWVHTSLITGQITSLAANSNNVFAGFYGGGIYRSTNNGGTWTFCFGLGVHSITANGNNIFAGTLDWKNPHGVFISTNNGINWSQTSLNNQQIFSLELTGNTIFAGTYTYGIYVSTNNGANWIQRNEGLPANITVNSFCISNNNIFAGTSLSVWRRPLYELTGIQRISQQIPSHYALEQNYPNPFNPSTKINFSISASSPSERVGVRLVIYDILGREIATLVNEQLKPGNYEVEWEASNYPSEVYFYKLITDRFTETKKMILIK